MIRVLIINSIQQTFALSGQTSESGIKTNWIPSKNMSIMDIFFILQVLYRFIRHILKFLYIIDISDLFNFTGDLDISKVLQKKKSPWQYFFVCSNACQKDPIRRKQNRESELSF